MYHPIYGWRNPFLSNSTYNNKAWKKIIINVFWDNHHDIFQMYIIPTHLDLMFLTSASDFFWAHQGLGFLFLPKHFEISYSLLTVRQCVLKVFGWSLFKKKKYIYLSFWCLKELGWGGYQPLAGEFSLLFFLPSVNYFNESLSSHFDSEVSFFP